MKHRRPPVVCGDGGAAIERWLCTGFLCKVFASTSHCLRWLSHARAVRPAPTRPAEGRPAAIHSPTRFTRGARGHERGRVESRPRARAHSGDPMHPTTPRASARATGANARECGSGAPGLDAILRGHTHLLPTPRAARASWPADRGPRVPVPKSTGELGPDGVRSERPLEQLMRHCASPRFGYDVRHVVRRRSPTIRLWACLYSAMASGLHSSRTPLTSGPALVLGRLGTRRKPTTHGTPADGTTTR